MELDTLEVPRLLCRAGGDWQLESGRYSVLVVKTHDELRAALADGWHLDQYAAKAAAEAPAKADDATDEHEPPIPQADDDAPPTKEELQQRLTELGVDFDARWGAKRLQEALDASKA